METHYNIYVYDIEVFAEDWVVVFRNVDDTEGNHTVIHNNNHQLREFLSSSEKLLCGFNSKHYDDWILLSMVLGADNLIVKKHNDFIISGKNGWEFPFVQFKRRPFKSFDLRDDLDRGLSLKAIEGNLGMNIVESSIPFDIERPLTQEELEETIFYCKHDVDATLELFKRRKDYLESKKVVGELKGIDISEALRLTNARLSAIYLDAKKESRYDEREYTYPKGIDLSVIPSEILNFFDQIHDHTIPSDKLFKMKLEIELGGCPCIFAWGGVHGALPNYMDESTQDELILNDDVASLYPNSKINFGYCSRNIPDPKAYEELVKKRLKAKRAGDKKTANALKLVINTAYGAMLNEWNELYDPKMGRSVCITNQLAMTDLAMHLIKTCSTFRIINFNTDGIMFKIHKNEREVAQNIIRDWENRTRFEMEEDEIQRIIQKDVNNYIEVKTDGKVKAVGDYVKMYNDDDFLSNQIKANSIRIVHRALVDYLVHDIPVEETIHKATNIFEFQMIAKTGATYQGAFHEFNGERIPVQKVNRVYATTDVRYGTIKKIKADGRADKIQNIPEHCLIDNENVIDINDIDKEFYINLCKKRINDYCGIQVKKEKKRMATRKKTESTLPKSEEMNVYQKLQYARTMFLQANPKKSGVNRFAQFDYFELKDIVPTATNIFNELGVTFTISFGEMGSVGTFVNLNNTEEQIRFTVPVRVLDYKGIKGMNAIQGLGAEITYVRRYLYQLCLDIVEADEIDAIIGSPVMEPETIKDPVKNTKTVKEEPVKKENKVTQEETKEESIAMNDPLKEDTKKLIVETLRKIREKSDEQEDFIADIVERLGSVETEFDGQSMLITVTRKLQEV